MIGKHILHYTILEKLGEGGMGIVYKAHDSKLNRDVAIKFLPRHISADSNERKRFEIEAKAAAALNHANIATIHAIEHSDEDIFIVMEYIAGKELKERIRKGLTFQESAGFARQIASGMRAAQEKGIVHRDIKSANIMITESDQLKIMDFGLAKIQGGVELTRERSTLGTAAYMSPEQAQGQEADHRSDIWSFGIVLYEMLTGQLPFKGNYEQAVIYAIINEEPDFPQRPGSEVPENMIRVVQKCLKKDPDQRYQTFKSLIDDLDAANDARGPVITPAKSRAADKPAFSLKYLIAITGLVLVIAGSFLVWNLSGTGQTPGEQPYNSIAVLPLESDEKTEYLSDGMTEGIINSLARVPDLRVVPRSIVFRYKGKNEDIAEIGSQTDVEVILTGRVTRRGNEVIVQVDLIDLNQMSQIWGEQYTRRDDQVLDLQSDIVRHISDRMNLALSGDVRQDTDKKVTENPRAYEFYLQGRYFWQKRKTAELDKAVEFFNRAIDIDPGFALAYAGLADTYLLQNQYSSISSRETLPKAEAAAKKALELDNSLAEVHATLGLIYNNSWQWQKAEQEYKEALELDPGYPTASHWYALFLYGQRRFNESLDQALRAHQLDPVSVPISATVCVAYFELHDFEKALNFSRKAIEIDSTHFLGHLWSGLVYLRSGEHQNALAMMEKANRLSGRSAETLGYLGYTYGILGMKKEARAVLDELQARFDHTHAFRSANVYAGLGDVRQVVIWLNKAYEEGNSHVYHLASHIWDPFRSDPEFITVLNKFNLPGNLP